jgi:hypothetical protein
VNALSTLLLVFTVALVLGALAVQRRAGDGKR